MISATRREIPNHIGPNVTYVEASISRYDSIKSVLDLVFALVLLAILGPLLLLLMLLVRVTSRGPAIYIQKRSGRWGRPFTILKLRSMYLDSEQDGIRWSQPGDPRVTPLGRFLRLSHLDELPQLVNVIRGEMSLVGPRPERPEIIAQLERSLPNYRVRLRVRPGITGLSQVLQPPDTDLGSVRRKLSFDLYYVNRLSLAFDLRILVGTLLVLMCVPSRVIARLLRFPGHSLRNRESDHSRVSIESVETTP
jgi:lipopolysaccharide/colanic/teichoic acid biosynthesis glycosyltransferase